MTLAEPDGPPATMSVADRFHRLLARRTADPAFRSWAARIPLIRRVARRDGERLFDLMAGFAYSQVLQALVTLDLLSPLRDGPQDAARLAAHAGLTEDRMAQLCRAAESLDLFRRDRRGDYMLTRLGVALATVPGLAQMVEHHAILYRDLSDPAAFFQGRTEPELAAFWPYVFGAGAADDPATAARYSALMADSQGLVAEEVLKAVDLSNTRRLMDVGGGTGTFLAAALHVAPGLQGTLVDLPAVVAAAGARLADPDISSRVTVHGADFRNDPLLEGADTITLIRVLYDHADETVLPLLRKLRAALPVGGRLIVAEPMSAGDPPDRFADGYFALYCMAMKTGRLRSTDEIMTLCKEAGFASTCERAVHRPFVTRVIEARS